MNKSHYSAQSLHQRKFKIKIFGASKLIKNAFQKYMSNLDLGLDPKTINSMAKVQLDVDLDNRIITDVWDGDCIYNFAFIAYKAYENYYNNINDAIIYCNQNGLRIEVTKCYI